MTDREEMMMLLSQRREHSQRGDWHLVAQVDIAIERLQRKIDAERHYDGVYYPREG